MVDEHWMNTQLLDPRLAFSRTLNASYSQIERTGIILLGPFCVDFVGSSDGSGTRILVFLPAQLLIETRTAWGEVGIYWEEEYDLARHARSKF